MGTAGDHVDYATDAEGRVVVLEPTVPQAITYTRWAATVSQNSSDATLMYGDATHKGIEFTGTVTAPPGFGGVICFIQLLNDWRHYTDDGGNGFAFSTGGYVLDRIGPIVPYNSKVVTVSAGATASVTCEDSPLSAKPVDYQSIDVVGDFADFLMFKPGSYSDPNTIWVTVRKFRWGWEGHAKNNNPWSIDPPVPPTAPVQGPSQQLPEWNARWQDLINSPGYQPETLF